MAGSSGTSATSRATAATGEVRSPVPRPRSHPRTLAPRARAPADSLPVLSLPADYYSFVQRMKAEARRRGVDLLLVDAGDRVDGNGLVDAEPSPHPKGYTALDIFSRVPYDVVTTVRAHTLSLDSLVSS